jgi:hypothetical protein
VSAIVSGRLTLESGVKLFAALNALAVLAIGWLVVASDLFS